MSRYSDIVEIIRDFQFSVYGLDDLDEMKQDPSTSEWILDLANQIDRKI
jgi:hypothetical protein